MKLIISKMKYNIQERVFLVKKIYELQNISLVKVAWRSNSKSKTAPSATTIKKIIIVILKQEVRFCMCLQFEKILLAKAEANS
jgi:hypothetical protein